MKRQDSKLWRQLKIVLAVLTNLCRERIYNASGVGMFGLRRNRVDPLAGQVQLETIHQLQGNVFKKQFGTRTFILFSLSPSPSLLMRVAQLHAYLKGLVIIFLQG